MLLHEALTKVHHPKRLLKASQLTRGDLVFWNIKADFSSPKVKKIFGVGERPFPTGSIQVTQPLGNDFSLNTDLADQSFHIYLSSTVQGLL